MSKIKNMREKKGLSQSQLAKASGVSIHSVHGYDQKKVDIDEAKLKTLVKLSNALDCGISDILEDENLIKNVKF